MVDHEPAGRLLTEMVRIARTLRHAGLRSQRQSLAGTKYGFLQRLRHCDARVGELAEHLGVSMPVASRAIDALEADGLASRRPDPDDARASIISISETGRETLRERDEYITGHFADELSDWTDEQVEEAITTLQNLTGHLADVLNRAADRAHPPSTDTATKEDRV